MLRPQVEDAAQRVGPACEILAREAEDEVEAEIGDAGSTQGVDGAQCIVSAVAATDGRQL